MLRYFTCFKLTSIQLAAPAKIPPATLAKLSKLGIRHRADLLLHLPLRYEDETRIEPIETAEPGRTMQVQGVITQSEIAFRPRRTLLCRLRDETGELSLRFLHFYPSQTNMLAKGQNIRAVGEVRMGFHGLEMVHPKCSKAGEDTPLMTSLTPVYPTTAGLSQTALRKLIANAIEVIPMPDHLPEDLRMSLTLAEFSASVKLLHNPTPDIPAESLEDRSHPAWRRIKFDELLAQQISMRVHHLARSARRAPALKAKGHYCDTLLKSLPFSLTSAQQKVVKEIGLDLARPHPMQRLLLGDVGSGKTIVAALAALQAIENGYQVAFMAPTEILAEQHYLKLSSWLAPLGIIPAWLSGSLKQKEKRLAAEKIASGETLLAIGTHALFQQQISFHNLGLAIVDEQHKFGVEQRLALHEKGKEKSTEPHQLMMSATPIPRTLAMSYYADLDVSVIDTLPPGRTPVTTKLVSDGRRSEVFERVRSACLAGQQAYWVCPLIEESETLELQSAMETYQQLCLAFPDLRVGLVHGRMESSEKAHVMNEFKAGSLQLLVATTVIEVGVDVPNASLMVIDHAERMGLAQLHQLRGRVGRGAQHSLCILLYQQPLSELARTRLKVIFENTDGFAIAEQDLILRGPGELLGARQSGIAMLRFADINADEDLLEHARTTVDVLLRDHPDAARGYLQRWMAKKHEFLHA